MHAPAGGVIGSPSASRTGEKTREWTPKFGSSLTSSVRGAEARSLRLPRIVCTVRVGPTDPALRCDSSDICTNTTHSTEVAAPKALRNFAPAEILWGSGHPCLVGRRKHQRGCVCSLFGLENPKFIKSSTCIGSSRAGCSASNTLTSSTHDGDHRRDGRCCRAAEATNLRDRHGGRTRAGG